MFLPFVSKPPYAVGSPETEPEDQIICADPILIRRLKSDSGKKSGKGGRNIPRGTEEIPKEL